MLATLILAVMFAAPAGPSTPADHWELGPLSIDKNTTLTWPGLYVPSFTLVHDRRHVHRLTLGLDLAGLRSLSFDAVLVEPSDDPDLRARTSHLPTGEGSHAYAWTGVRFQLPNPRWQLSLGRSSTIGSAVARSAMGRPGGWSVNVLRALR